VAVAREPLDAARTLRWLRKLKKNNDRAWYAANRAEYDETIKPGWEDLVAGLLVSAIPLDARFAYVDPRQCIFRLARDIRFSNDKTPFKTAVTAWMSPFGKHGSNPGFYARIAPGNSIFSAGIYVPEKPVLDALRRRILKDARPFAKILAAKKLQPYLPLETDPLTRMPRGFPKEHPRGEWIRARNYLVRRSFTDAEIAKNGAFATFRAALRDCAPFVRYLDEVAATASSAAMRDAIDGWDENSSSDHFGP
jgi:uncharacterized protein (TIGR02453 family)